MGWVLLRIYSFTCDHPAGCDVGYDALGAGGGYWQAVRELQSAGWQVVMLVRGRTHYCPSHRQGSL